MKTYFLALNKNDFNISANTWTSNIIDIYSNRFYTNFVGTQILQNATPSINESTKVTDYGEIKLDTDSRNFPNF